MLELIKKTAMDKIERLESVAIMFQGSDFASDYMILRKDVKGPSDLYYFIFYYNNELEKPMFCYECKTYVEALILLSERLLVDNQADADTTDRYVEQRHNQYAFSLEMLAETVKTRL